MLPSATEIVEKLGLIDSLVGRSHECDFPEKVKKLPVLTGPKFQSDGTSKSINTEVSKLIQDGLSVYWVNTELLNELKPDFILTQSQCEVCAVSMKEVEEAVCNIISSNPKIINLEPLGYNDLFKDFINAGNDLNATARANDLVKHIESEIEKVEVITNDIEEKKSVACIEWIEPMMNAGNWIPTVIEKAGGINTLGKESSHSHYITMKDLIKVNPDIILVMPCGFDIKRTLEEMYLLESDKEWENLRAVQMDNVYITDGNQYFNRPGPRILESVQIVAEILYPEIFNFGLKNKAWIKF